MSNLPQQFGLLRSLAIFEYLAAALATARAGINRLEALGRYEYNWSPGERRRLQSPNWLSAYQMLAALPAAARQGASGDIYARYLCTLAERSGN